MDQIRLRPVPVADPGRCISGSSPRGSIGARSGSRSSSQPGTGTRRSKGSCAGSNLNTVCEEARCPNIAECWGHGTATFMILGDVCTRACAFCAVKSGKRGGDIDWDEPRRVGEAVRSMGLRHAVVTSVDRDDLADGGAGVFAATIR